MNTRRVVGRRIAAIEQRRVPRAEAQRPWTTYDVLAIVLDDGTRLVPEVAELESQYAITMRVVRPR